MLYEVITCQTDRFHAQGKLQTVLKRVDQAHHTFRAYFKNSLINDTERYYIVVPSYNFV